MLYRNIYRKRAQSFQSRYHPVLRLRSDCSVYLFTLKGPPPTKLSWWPTTTNYLLQTAVLLEKGKRSSVTFVHKNRMAAVNRIVFNNKNCFVSGQLECALCRTHV